MSYLKGMIEEMQESETKKEKEKHHHIHSGDSDSYGSGFLRIPYLRRL